jgi:zinc protease
MTTPCQRLAAVAFAIASLCGVPTVLAQDKAANPATAAPPKADAASAPKAPAAPAKADAAARDVPTPPRDEAATPPKGQATPPAKAAPGSSRIGDTPGPRPIPQKEVPAKDWKPDTRPASLKKLHDVEGIREYAMPNGLRVLLFPDDSKATVTVNITYLVGSRVENYGETGMAHLLEHLMFKGTPNHKAIDQEYNQRGVRYNGTTWLDRTNYYEIFQASDANLEWAIELEADRMVNSYIARRDLDSEMTVVRNEYESGENSPTSVMMKRLQSIAYDWHSYGRSTIGNRSDIENVDIPHLQAFYRTYYQPDNAVLLIAGRFDETKAIAMIAKSFGKVPRPARKIPAQWTVEPTQDGPREFTVRRKGDVQMVTVAYHIPSSLHDDSDPLGFTQPILAVAPNGRLHKALVEKGLAAQVFGYPLQGRDPGLMIFGAMVKLGQPLEPVRDEMLRVIEALGTEAPTAEEIERNKLYYLNQIEKLLADPESVGVQMSEYIALGDWRLFFDSRDRISGMNSAEVARVAAKYFKRDNRTIGYFVPDDSPQRTEIPAAPTAEEVLKGFKPKTATSQAEAFDPSQDNIDKRTKHLQFGGIKVALLPKKNRGETVAVTINLHTGNLKDLKGQRENAAMAGRMLSRGTTKYTRAQLSDEFEKLKISGRVAGTSAGFETTGANLEAALRLTAHVMREPRFDPAEFEQLRTQIITALQGQLSEPEARASDALSKHFNQYAKDDPRYSPSLEESIEEVKNVKLEDVKRYHARFYGAPQAEIAIVGDFDAEKIAPVLRDLFSDWKAEVPYERIPLEYKDIAPDNIAIKTPDKENAIFLARENVQMRDDDPDFPALYLANYILGGGAGFDSRLGARIRQKDGLSYGVGSELSVGSIDRVGSFSAYAIAAPANVAKVESAFKEEMARALKEGFTEAEVASAKSGSRQMRQQSRAQDGNLAPAWANFLYLGRTFQWSKDFDAKIAALTPADLVKALRKHVDPAKMTIVKAGDFK